jgi:hypothetical protein
MSKKSLSDEHAPSELSLRIASGDEITQIPIKVAAFIPPPPQPLAGPHGCLGRYAKQAEGRCHRGPSPEPIRIPEVKPVDDEARRRVEQAISEQGLRGG